MIHSSSLRSTTVKKARKSVVVFAALALMQVAERASAATTTVTIEQMAHDSWDYLAQSSAWTFAQPELSVQAQNSAVLDVIEYSPAFSNVEESSWMAIIDLIQSCQLQLDPIPTLET